jgi:hypothetical protein
MDGARENPTHTPGWRDPRPPRPSDRDRRPTPDRGGKKPATPPALVFRGANSKNLEVLKAFSKKLSDSKEEKS